MNAKELPRILYFSDVPVELTYAGATLMYRLLEHYPKDRLMIVQGGGLDPKQRIPGIEYIIVQSKLDRLKFTRFAKFAKALVIAGQMMSFRKAKANVLSFNPDIVLTVSLHLMWLKAFRLSKQLNIPFHVILHDDWLTAEQHGKWQKYLSGMFGKMYRHATGRFCISPAMEKYYYSLYGVHGQLLYPLRGKDDHVFATPEKKEQQTLKYCYAGSLFTGDFPSMLNEISRLIGEQGGELHIFSHRNKKELAKYTELAKAHVSFHGLVPPAKLMRIMNEEMDVAILLNSFLHEQPFMYNFSSKLVDYTTAGLPVLIWGPGSSGAISWALSSGYNAVVTVQDPKEIEKLLEQFKNDEVRTGWAKQMKALGAEQFSYEYNYKTFINQISSR